MPSVSRQFFRHVLPGVLKPIRVLWNEMIAFVFVVLALLVGLSVYRKWQTYDGSVADFFAVTLGGGFALLMAGYGLSSFLRARRISRG